MITDTVSVVEYKGKDIIRVHNYKRLIIASNEDWAAPMGMDDRRFVSLDISDAHKEDQEYFGAIAHELQNGGKESLMSELLLTDLTGFNPREKPQSNSGLDMKIMSSDSVTQWWFNVLKEGLLPSYADGHYDRLLNKSPDGNGKWPPEPKSHIHRAYQEDAVRGKQRNVVDQPEFFKRLGRMVSIHPSRPNGSGIERPRYAIFPPLNECRRMFEKYAKLVDYDWEKD